MDEKFDGYQEALQSFAIFLRLKSEDERACQLDRKLRTIEMIEDPFERRTLQIALYNQLTEICRENGWTAGLSALTLQPAAA
ncbi:MAG: hypothetical protein JSS72_13050 [Armatimonadetes bacterium]|nr:hypothetical protein [Armatimonadota bacterium]